MPERWERELRKLRRIDPNEHSVRERAARGPSRQGPSRGGRERVVAGFVAVVVFGAAAAFAWGALRPSDPPVPSPGAVGDLPGWPSLLISVNAEPGQEHHPDATFRYGEIENTIPPQGGTGWDLGNAFDAIGYTLPTGIPSETRVVLDSNASDVEISVTPCCPLPEDPDAPAGLGEDGVLPARSGHYRLEVAAGWPDGRAEFTIFIDLFEARDVLRVDCSAEVVPALWPVVAARPDGVHVEFTTGSPTRFDFGGSGIASDAGGTLEPGTTRLSLPLAPGIATIACEEVPTSQITIVDPGGFWAPAEVECPSGDEVVSLAAEETEERLIDEATIVERLLTVLGSDEVVPPGYPETIRRQPLPSKVVVRREGQTVAKLDVWLGRPARVEGTACASAAIRPKEEAVPSPTAEEPTGGIVVSVFGVGEGGYEQPTATFSFDGQTGTACTESWEWIVGEGQSDGGEAFCSGGPAIEVPPGTPIAIEAATTTRVSATRTTTPFFEGNVWLVVNAEWPEGNATFIMPLSVDPSTPDLELVVLDCRPGDQVPITPPENRIEPAGSAYIVGNIPGFEQSDVVEQMTREEGSDAGDLAGVWQVVRDGTVVASVDYPELSGTACAGSGIGEP